MTQPVLVQGAGSWGTALALVLARNNHQVYLWDIDSDVIEDIKLRRYNARYFCKNRDFLKFLLKLF